MANFKPDKKVINKQNRQKRRRDLEIHYRLERDVGGLSSSFRLRDNSVHLHSALRFG